MIFRQPEWKILGLFFSFKHFVVIFLLGLDGYADFDGKVNGGWRSWRSWLSHRPPLVASILK